MNQKISTMFMIIKQPPYAALASLASIAFGMLHYFLSMSFLQDHFAVVAKEMPLYLGTSLSLSALVAVLAGINVSLIVFKIKRTRTINLKKAGGSTLFGGTFAAFTPGCPACTTPLAVLLGTVGGLAIFPLQGLEIKLLSIAILSFSIYWITKGIQHPSCCSMEKK